MISLLLGAPVWAAQEFVYEVHSDGKNIGSMAITSHDVVHDGQEARETLVSTKLRVKKLFVTLFSLDSEERNIVGDSGLILHESHTKIDGELISVKGVRDDDRLMITIDADEQTQTYPVDLNEFDCTSAETPQLVFTTPGIPLSMRVMDLDRLEIVEQSLTWVRDDTLMFDEHSVPCRVFDVSDSYSQSRYWVAQDPLETLLKEEGSDEDGPYQVILVRYPEALH